MFKMIGSSFALAFGAGALYYWWTHDHSEMSDELRHYSEELHQRAKKAKEEIEQA